MKVILFSDHSINDYRQVEDDKVICEIDDLTEMPECIIDIDGRKASVCALNISQNVVYIEYIKEMPRLSEVPFEHEITCPHCGIETSDSWECSDEDEMRCDTCGSEFSYVRNVEVTYSSKIINRNEKVLKLETKSRGKS